uniref:Uncharacterized protein n=1 Tax=Arundo donax TaxID=35708 RepID=A0A0A9FKE9_ARUDO
MRSPVELYSPNIQTIKDRAVGSLILSRLRTKRIITFSWDTGSIFTIALIDKMA